MLLYVRFREAIVASDEVFVSGFWVETFQPAANPAKSAEDGCELNPSPETEQPFGACAPERGPFSPWKFGDEPNWECPPFLGAKCC